MIALQLTSRKMETVLTPLLPWFAATPVTAPNNKYVYTRHRSANSRMNRRETTHYPTKQKSGGRRSVQPRQQLTINSREENYYSTQKRNTKSSAFVHFRLIVGQMRTQQRRRCYGKTTIEESKKTTDDKQVFFCRYPSVFWFPFFVIRRGK